MSKLTYKEAWDELKTRLADAETSLLVLRNRGGVSNAEKTRYDAKLEGLRIAREYVREVDPDICDEEDGTNG